MMEKATSDILKNGNIGNEDVLLVKPFEDQPFANPEFLNHTHNGIDSPRIFANNILDNTGSAQAATFVIGPSSNADSASYDYVTDGTDDNIQIQAAIDALPSNGGMIVFREGTYILGSATVNINKSGVTLQGMGGGSIVTCKTSFNKVFFKLGHASIQYYNCVIQDFYFDGNASNVSMSDLPLIDNRTLANPVINGLFQNCYFVNIGNSILHSANRSNDRFQNNYVSGWDSSGFDIFRGYAIGGDSYVINNTFILSTNSRGVVLGVNSFDGGTFNNNTVKICPNYNSVLITICNQAKGNVITMTSGSCGASAIVIKEVSIVDGNTIDMGSSTNIASIAITAWVIVTNNYIFSCGKGIAFPNNSTCKVVGNDMTGCLGHGIHVNNAANGTSPHLIIGNRVAAGSAAANTYSGILVEDGILAVISGNHVYSASGVNKLKYGIAENAIGAKTIISSNWIYNTATQDIFVQNPLSDVSHNMAV